MAKLTKLSDDKFKGNHPNGIDAGRTEEGMIVMEPIVGFPCWVGTLRTSTVTEIVAENDTSIQFKTLNSTYLLEK